MGFKQITYLLLLLVAFSNPAKATHIVGGDINYTYLGSSQYRITLDLYIDCVNGNAGAIDDDSFAIVNFFNARTNEFISKDEHKLIFFKRVEELHYKCLRNEPNACVLQFSFSFVKNIDPGNDGVILSFQRCCRNRTITNIVDPEATGGTFWTRIPPVSDAAVNSSARFQKLPPNFLCTDAPLIFDHSAVDADGDSLVYNLYIPFEGATSMSPRPLQSSPPPFKEIQLNTPYTLTDLMGGTVKLNIDRESGELRVTPSTVGQFVVGIKVQEYRNGSLLSTTYRDYQMNVIQCSFDVIADFDGPERLCTPQANFTNNSQGDDLIYDWNFGDLTTTTDVSQNEHTSYVYPGPGKYKIWLVVHNDACIDSFYRFVTIVPKDSIFARFSIDPKEACDSLTINIVNASDDAEEFIWDFGDGETQTINTDFTKYFFGNAGVYPISLRLTDSNSCNITHSDFDTVTIRGHQKATVSLDASYKEGCASDGIVSFEASVSNSNDYVWDFGEGTTLMNAMTDSFLYTEPGNFTIRLLTRDTGDCFTNDTAQVEVVIENPIPVFEEIKLYNVFTPDNDNYNSCYSVEISRPECVEYSFMVYNRWGECMYSTEDINDCWNGHVFNTDQELPESTYFGIFKFRNVETNEEEILSNSITLIRNQ